MQSGLSRILLAKVTCQISDRMLGHYRQHWQRGAGLNSIMIVGGSEQVRCSAACRLGCLSWLVTLSRATVEGEAPQDAGRHWVSWLERWNTTNFSAFTPPAFSHLSGTVVADRLGLVVVAPTVQLFELCYSVLTYLQLPT